MREFIMPAGRFSGRRYVYMTPSEYREYDKKHDTGREGPLNMVYVNALERVLPKTVREMVDYLYTMHEIKEELSRDDTMTLVTSRPIIWSWLSGVALEGILDYTIAIAKSSPSMFDILPLPESELLLELTGVKSALLIPKMPRLRNVQCSVMCSADRIHWALGALKQAGRPDVSIYVNIQSLSPEMRGAST